MKINPGIVTFILLVFFSVFLLSQGSFIPILRNYNKLRKRIRLRLETLAKSADGAGLDSIIRQQYLRPLSPIERQIETLPSMERFGHLIQQAGKKFAAYQVIIATFSFSVFIGVVSWMIFHSWLLSLLALLLLVVSPLFYFHHERMKRFAKFEEQLPEAIDLMQRALRAGHPFTQTLKLVADSMDEPISTEFATTFSDINYGGDMRRAMLGLLDRVPSVSVMMLATAVSLQRDTGGDLAESLGKISAVIRNRFKFQRKVKTLSAEGRLSGYILVLMPVALFVFMWLFSRDYIGRLLNHPKGMVLIQSAVALAIVGVIWIKRLIRIEV